MSKLRDDDIERLSVRVRRTEQGDSESALDLTVFCPVRGHAMSLDDCRRASVARGDARPGRRPRFPALSRSPG